jgi:ribosomal protein S18 acetylase RimI-like enzyme
MPKSEITYTDNDTIDVAELDSFFRNWLSPPSKKIKQKLIKGADLMITARNKDKQLVGFLAAITDNAMFACITLVEVHEDYQGMGIGKQLMKRALSCLKGNYDIILITDPDKTGFYKKLGFTEICGMHRQDFTYGGRVRLVGKKRVKK